LEGRYNIKTTHLNYLKQRDLVKMIKILLSIYLLFLIVVLLNDENSIDEILWLSFIYFTLIGITLTLRYFTNSPLDNTIIVIHENSITREGNGLRTVTIKFDEISNIKNIKDGIVLFDDQPSSKSEFKYFGHAITHSSGILFIPVNIESYEDIKEFIMSKLN
jgi:lipid-A-disaccharide synthase-like uncharacterized protein